MRTSSWRLLGRGRQSNLPLCRTYPGAPESPARSVVLPERFRGGFAPSAPRTADPPARLAPNLPARTRPARIPRVWRVTYPPGDDRYAPMTSRRTGRSGLLLPAISLGLWHNVGDER